MEKVTNKSVKSYFIISDTADEIILQRLSEKHRSMDWIYRMDDKRRRRVGRGRASCSLKHSVSYITKDDQR